MPGFLNLPKAEGNLIRQHFPARLFNPTPNCYY
jgi:hypothetical protein